jgi:hypothetical protein
VVVDQRPAEPRHLRRRIVGRLVRVRRRVRLRQICGDLDGGLGGSREDRCRVSRGGRDRCGDVADLAGDVTGRARDMAEATRHVTEPAHAFTGAQESDQRDEANHDTGYSKHYASEMRQPLPAFTRVHRCASATRVVAVALSDA